MWKKELRLIYKCDLQNLFTSHIYLIYTYKNEFGIK